LTDNDLISRAKAKAFKRDDMSAATVAIEKPYTVDSEPGVYKVTLYVAEEPTTKVEINVTVVAGNGPSLTVEPAYMNIPVGGTYDYTYGVSAIDDEDGDLTSKVKSTGTVNVNEEGVYPIVYTVTDKDYNTATKTRVVTVGDIIPGEDYLFKASNYVILKKDVKGTDAEILEKTGAQAWVKETGIAVPKADLEVRSNGGYKAEVGDYKTTISVKGATSTKDKVEPTAKVVDGNVIDDGDKYTLVASNIVMTVEEAKAITSDAKLIDKAAAKAFKKKDLSAGTVKVDASGTNFKAEEGDYKATFYVGEEEATRVEVKIKVMDGDIIDHGDEYTIVAKHVQLTRSQAEALTDNDLISRAKAKAFKRDDMSAATVAIEKPYTVDSEPGVYKVTLYVAEEPTTKVEINVTVVTGNGPSLTVEPDYMNIPVGGTYDNTYGVSAIDDEDGDLTSKVTSSGTVNVNEEGVYPVVYTVTDKDHNTATKTRIVAVGDIIVGEDYLFKASNYVILKKDVKGTDAEILEKTGAQAWVKETGIAVPKADLEVKDNGGYKAEVGDYKTTISVKGATSAKDKVEPTAKVVDGNVIDDGDKYTLVASNIVMTVDEAKAITSDAKLIDKAAAKAFKKKDLSAGTVKVDASGTNFKAEEGDYKATFYVGEEEATRVEVKIKVIDGDIIDHGDEYTIVAKHVQLTRSQAEALTNADLISRAKAKAFKRDDMSEGKVAVTHDVGSTVGTYSATYHVVEEPTTKVDADVTVINGNAPELTVEPAYMNIPVGGTYDYTHGVSATDKEDGDLTKIVRPTGTVNVNEEGVYPIVYTVTDNDHNTVSKTRIVTVGDIIVGEDYLFKANNYVILKNEMNGTDAEILEKSEAQAWVRETGIAVPAADLEVRDNGG
ncbi:MULTISPECIES: immunoglobulin-like domain-containing protein, partial [unclassified Breznakia]